VLAVDPVLVVDLVLAVDPVLVVDLVQAVRTFLGDPDPRVDRTTLHRRTIRADALRNKPLDLPIPIDQELDEDNLRDRKQDQLQIDLEDVHPADPPVRTILDNLNHSLVAPVHPTVALVNPETPTRICPIHHRRIVASVRPRVDQSSVPHPVVAVVNPRTHPHTRLGPRLLPEQAPDHPRLELLLPQTIIAPCLDKNRECVRALHDLDLEAVELLQRRAQRMLLLADQIDHHLGVEDHQCPIPIDLNHIIHAKPERTHP